MSLITPAAIALEAAGHPPRLDDLTRLEQASVVRTLKNLMTFPWISERVQARELQLLGAYFDVATGCLSAWDGETATFVPVVHSHASRTPA